MDRDALEGYPPDGGRSRVRFDVRCSARVLAKWREAEKLCRRMAGSTSGVLHTAEWVPAEVFSGLPRVEVTRLWPGWPRASTQDRCADGAALPEEPPGPEPPCEPAPFDLAQFLDGLADADPFAPDSRLSDLLQREHAVRLAPPQRGARRHPHDRRPGSGCASLS